MAEQTFRSPGFFEREIDLSQREKAPLGTPAGIIGTAEKGPAFVPVTVGSFADFETRFGTLDSNRFGPYAVKQFLDKRGDGAVTYMRTLGAGANKSTADISTTDNKGTVKNAGFRIASTAVDGGGDYHRGVVQFICGRHVISGTGDSVSENGLPLFHDNGTFSVKYGHGDQIVNLVRGMVFTATGTRAQVFDGPGLGRNAPLDSTQASNYAHLSQSFADPDGSGLFLIAISSSAGTGFSNDDNYPGVRLLTASLNPASDHYIAKVLNTDPSKFQQEEHLLYADFAVDNEVAHLTTTPIRSTSGGACAVAILSGTGRQSGVSGDTSVAFRDAFGRFDTRYTTPKTPNIISQPFGGTEYDLFHFETLSDGTYANDRYKISISNVKASTNPRSDFGSFTVMVREFGDSDLAPKVVEQFTECNIDPNSDRYIAKIVGDTKAFFDHDAELEDERRVVVTGKYPNISSLIRVVMKNAVEEGNIPEKCLPFGFRGLAILKTTDGLTAHTDTSAPLKDSAGKELGSQVTRLAGSSSRGGVGGYATFLTGAVIPPLPYRYKVTRGATASSSFAGGMHGDVGATERVDPRLYWGAFTQQLAHSGTASGKVSNSIINPNIGSAVNELARAYTKFLGIKKLDVLVTGSGRDEFNAHKFTLARVALPNKNFTDVTGSAKAHMKRAAYIRNGRPDASTYKITDPKSAVDRITFATLVNSSSVTFNRFSDYAKFTTIFQGGFDGLNILDKNNAYMLDRAGSVDGGGKAASGYTDHGLGDNYAGTNKDNNIIASFRTAAKIMTDPMTVNINILAIPGMRDTLITDHAADNIEDYGKAIYLMDTLSYDEDKNRLFDDRASTVKVDARETAEQFDSRAVDNNYVATYFPDVFITDDVNNRIVHVPASIAAISALGVNDRLSYPWFAPAGFSRGALDFVHNVDTRLSQLDRDNLYDARINPIATFPNEGFVIFGQKTLQYAKSALDRVNVRRLLLEVKRQVVDVARRLVFEQNSPETRARFIGEVQPLLSVVQAQAGIEQFRIVMDNSNNSQDDVENNRLNGTIILVPTRTIEFIAIDFIITNAGVEFV